MKTLAALAIAAGTAIAGPASAAEPFTARWSGFYAGLNLGYGWGASTRSMTFDPNDVTSFAGTCGGVFGGTCAQPAADKVNGVIGGAQVGYNWQLNRNLLLGVETDFQLSRLNGSGTSPTFFLGSFFATPSNFVVSEDLKWFGTLRGRLGWLPSDNFLIYATGGLAYGRIERSATLNSVAGTNLQDVTTGIAYSCVTGPACFVGRHTKTSTGWTAGAGAEYALGPNLSLKAEYLYMRFGGDSVVTTAVGPNRPASFTATFSAADYHIARVGLNFLFGSRLGL